MALTTFNPSIAPSPGTAHKPKVNVLEAEFGDGYSQAAPAGLNHIRQSLSLKWDGLTETQMIEFRTFFEDRGGYSLSTISRADSLFLSNGHVRSGAFQIPRRGVLVQS